MDWNNVICKNCGLINDYSIKAIGNNNVCNCNGCGTFLGNHPHEYNYKEVRMPFGKYKDELVSEISDIPYFEWLNNSVKLKGNLKKAVLQKIGRSA